MSSQTLWYRQPAIEWTDALPVGNGRLGAMVHGGVGREDIQLNEATLWSGGPYQPTNPEALPNLEQIRTLILAGRYVQAEQLANAHAMARPHLQMSYQSAGNLFLEFQHEAVPGSYRRELDLQTAIATTQYRLLGTGISDDAAQFTRECFVSHPAGILVLRLQSSKPGMLGFEAWLDSPQPGDWRDGDATSLDYRGTNFGENGIEGALRFGIGVDMRLEGGRAERRGRRLVVRGATSAVITVDIATSFQRFRKVDGDVEAALAQRRQALRDTSYDALRTEHERSWMAELAPDSVAVTLPRFRLAGTFRLAEVLGSLGLRQARSAADADFSGIDGGSGRLFLGEVIQQTFLECGEEGTEAAAATAAVMRASAAFVRAEPTVFRADRPFAFALRELRTGLVLFAGRVMDPRAA